MPITADKTMQDKGIKTTNSHAIKKITIKKKPSIEKFTLMRQFKNKKIREVTKQKMIQHALFLVDFKYSLETNLKDIEMLAFLYHFFRYNLSRRILAMNPDTKYQTVEWRTKFVHLINKISINERMIREDQEKLKEFIHLDIDNLQTEIEKKLVDENFLKLKSLCYQNKKSINETGGLESLSIYQKLYDKDLSFTPDFKSPYEFYQWIVNAIMPLLCLINSTKYPFSNDSLKMLILIFGGYCMQKNLDLLSMDRYLEQKFNDKNSQVTEGIKKFINLSRDARNILAHEISFKDSDLQMSSILSVAKDVPLAISKLYKVKPRESLYDDLLKIINPNNKIQCNKLEYTDFRFKKSH